MLECGVAPYIGLPKNIDIENFKNVCSRARTNKVNLYPITLVTALLKDENEIMDVYTRLRLSAFQRDLALFLVMHREDKPCPNLLKPYQSIVLNSKFKLQDILEFVRELLRYKGALKLLEEFENWKIPKFPINGHHLKPYVARGKMIGSVMSKLKNIWIENDFNMSQDDLVKLVPDIIADMEEARNK